MPRLDLIPLAQRKSEGLALRRQWATYQAEHHGMTQDRFCAEHGINQGQLQRWFSGARQIPEHRLIQLARIMGFNANIVRPSIQATAEAMNAVTNIAIRELEDRWGRLSLAQQREALRFLDLLERAGDPTGQ
jgi:hypothetical protein